MQFFLFVYIFLFYLLTDFSLYIFSFPLIYIFIAQLVFIAAKHQHILSVSVVLYSFCELFKSLKQKERNSNKRKQTPTSPQPAKSTQFNSSNLIAIKIRFVPHPHLPAYIARLAGQVKPPTSPILYLLTRPSVVTFPGDQLPKLSTA